MKAGSIFPLQNLCLGLPDLKRCICPRCGTFHEKLLEARYLAQYPTQLWVKDDCHCILCDGCRKEAEEGREAIERRRALKKKGDFNA